MRIPTALALLLLCLVVPASASATRMSVTPGADGSTYVEFRADDGFQNDVTVSQDGSAVVFHDAGEPITYPNECEPLDAQTVRCATTGTPVHTTVEVFDLDDRVSVVGVPNTVVAGARGNDTLSTDTGAGALDGGSGDDVLTGSAGDDFIVGAQGKDSLYGGAGNDVVAGDSASAYLEWDTDLIDGGPGDDLTIYGGRKNRGVKVDLTRTGGQGGPGENDTILGVEGVETSGGQDRITAPTLSAKCGRWLRDDVVRPGPQAIIARDCWRTYVDSSLIAFTNSWKVKDGTFSLPLRSDAECRADVALFDGDERLGRTSVSLPGDETRTARIATSHKGVVRLEARGCGPLLAFSIKL
jgi:hypothetical protein